MKEAVSHSLKQHVVVSAQYSYMCFPNPLSHDNGLTNMPSWIITTAVTKNNGHMVWPCLDKAMLVQGEEELGEGGFQKG